MSARIYYFSTSRHFYPLGIFAAYYARGVGQALRLLTYTALPAIRSFAPGAFILTDIDRLSPKRREEAGGFADALKSQGCLVLNHPATSLRRFDLLRTLHEAGINRFTVYRLPDWREVRRYPVFIRQENTHGRAVTTLLDDQAALRSAIAAIPPAKRADPSLMIVEFGNVRGDDGKYRKYAAFNVGGHIYAQHCYASADWLVKFDSAGLSEAEWQEHNRFAAENPHRDQLEAIFALAGIDYGRIDYCVVDGRVQVFEINTNPTIVHAGGWRSIDVGPYVRSHEEALAALLAQAPDRGRIDNPAAKAEFEESSPERIHTHVLDLVRQHWEAPGKDGATERG